MPPVGLWDLGDERDKPLLGGPFPGWTPRHGCFQVDHFKQSWKGVGKGLPGVPAGTSNWP